MAKLSALLMNRPANAPDGGFVVQLILGAARDGVHFYPTRDDVDAPAIAHAFRDLAMWVDLHPDDVARWYDGSDYPECAYARVEGIDATSPRPFLSAFVLVKQGLDMLSRHGAPAAQEHDHWREWIMSAERFLRGRIDDVTIENDPREKHPHMHARDCDVCTVIASMAHSSPWEERGLPGAAPRRVCQWCGVLWRDGDENPSHPSSCIWLRARGLDDVYGCLALVGLSAVHR